MYNERVTTFQTLKRLHQQERSVHRSHAIQNLVLVVVMLMGGAWLVCDANSACSADKQLNDEAATAVSESEAPEGRAAGKIKWLKSYDQALARARNSIGRC